MPVSQFDLLLAVKSNGVSQVVSDIKSVGQASSQAANQTQALPLSFAKVTQTATGMNSQLTTTRNVMGATVTTVSNTSKATGSFTSVLKNNVLAVSTAASSIIDLVVKYTQLRKAQALTEKAAIAEQAATNKVTDMRNKLTAAIQKYGESSSQVVKIQRDLEVAEQRAGLATQRHEILQEQLNTRMADFAVNILPDIIGSVGSVIQVLQGFANRQKELGAVTTITGEALAVQNAQMAIAKGQAAGMVGPLNAATVAEGNLGKAAVTTGTQIRTALVRTGIGALLVAAGTALVAFTQNWWGFRDAVYAAGKALGDFIPQLRPVLDFLNSTVGVGILRLFGVDIPNATDKTAGAMGALGEEFGDVAEMGTQAAQRIEQHWADTWKNLLVLPGATHKEWQEQFKKLSEFGFSKSGIHELKEKLFRPGAIATAITTNITEALSLVGKAKGLNLSGETLRELSNNLIDQINKGMKDAKGQLDFLGPLKEIIKSHKKDVDLPKLVADWFAGLPAELKAKLQMFQLDPNDIIEKLGFDPDKLAPALSASLQAVVTKFKLPTNFFDQAAAAGGGNLGLTAIMKNWAGGEAGLKETGKGWVADIIAGVQEALSPANLEKVRQQLVSALLALPGNIATLARNFIDPVLGGILDIMFLQAPKAVGLWLESMFSVANVNSALGALEKFGRTVLSLVGEAIRDPIGLYAQAGAFVFGLMEGIGKWFTANFPTTQAKLKAIGASLANAIREGFLEFITQGNFDILNMLPFGQIPATVLKGQQGVTKAGLAAKEVQDKGVKLPPGPQGFPFGIPGANEAVGNFFGGIGKGIQDAWNN